MQDLPIGPRNKHSYLACLMIVVSCVLSAVRGLRSPLTARVIDIADIDTARQDDSPRTNHVENNRQVAYCIVTEGRPPPCVSDSVRASHAARSGSLTATRQCAYSALSVSLSARPHSMKGYCTHSMCPHSMNGEHRTTAATIARERR